MIRVYKINSGLTIRFVEETEYIDCDFLVQEQEGLNGEPKQRIYSIYHYQIEGQNPDRYLYEWDFEKWVAQVQLILSDHWNGSQYVFRSPVNIFSKDKESRRVFHNPLAEDEIGELSLMILHESENVFLRIENTAMEINISMQKFNKSYMLLHYKKHGRTKSYNDIKDMLMEAERALEQIIRQP